MQGSLVNFGDPFVNDGYIILGPSPDEIEPDFSQSSSTHTGPSMGMVGLGYSLNRMRAPTPWIRGAAESSEWLIEGDMSDVRDVKGEMREAGWA